MNSLCHSGVGQRRDLRVSQLTMLTYRASHESGDVMFGDVPDL